MRFTALDSWRGLCALLVALYHIQYHGTYDKLAFADGSFLFVDFFFVLSGFVMSEAYTGRLTSAAELGPFAIRRFGRVWPLHMAVILGYIGVMLLGFALSHPGLRGLDLRLMFSGDRSLLGLAANIFLIHAMGLTPSLTWNGPSWSISAEFWAYMLFAPLLLLKPRTSAKVAAVIVGAAVVILVDRSQTLMNTTFRLGLVRGLYGFFTGVGLHWLFQQEKRQCLRMATLWELAAVVGVGYFVANAHDNAWSYVTPLAFAGPIYIFAFGQGAVSRLLNRSAFQRLGAWSYSVYMVHGLVILVVSMVMRHNEEFKQLSASRAGRDVLTLAVLALIVAVAAQTYRFIEMPAQTIFKRWAGRLTASQPAAEEDDLSQLRAPT